MERVLNLYKKSGETPLDCIERFRKEHLEYNGVVLSYAGRLDPMAEGVLLVLAGEENKRRAEYLKLPKEYEVEILFGFATDTYDILGLVNNGPNVWKGSSKDLEVAIHNNLKNFTRKFMQKYPPYSSKPVQGKPLFQWAREGRLHKIEVPTHEVEVYTIERLACLVGRQAMSTKTGKDLEEHILSKLAQVAGDFRQKEIIARWQQVLKGFEQKNFPIVKLRIECSSGTYVRGIAHDLGNQLGLGGLTLHIVRTRVGEFAIKKTT